jgi:hypothetical protein
VTSIDIELSPSLQQAFDLPACEELRLPLADPLQLELPSGGSMKALVDLSAGIPTDCAMSFNLMLQLQPLLVAIECPLRILKLLKPLTEIMGGLMKVPPDPPGPDLAAEFATAVAEIVPCFVSLAKIPLFVRDILKLIRAVLNCLLGQMRTLRDLMGGLQLRLATAEGNPDLLAALDCARDNAQASMNSLTAAIDPIAGVLALVNPILSIAGLSLDLELSSPSAAPSDLEAIDALIATLQTFVDALDLAIEGLGG